MIQNAFSLEMLEVLDNVNDFSKYLSDLDMEFIEMR